MSGLSRTSISHDGLGGLPTAQPGSDGSRGQSRSRLRSDGSREAASGRAPAKRELAGPGPTPLAQRLRQYLDIRLEVSDYYEVFFRRLPTSREILLTFGKRGLVLTVAGLAIGLALSTVASRFLNALLYGFRPDLVPTITVVSLMLLGVAALAVLAPARRASRVDPVVALRSE